ncbi:hypothetical protein ACTFIU_007510 [Dictyostelium citrinum]
MKRGFILFFFLFVFSRFNHATMVTSEYKCLFNLLSKILIVSHNFNLESKNRYALCDSEDKSGFTWAICYDTGYVDEIHLSGKNTSTILTSNDFICFESLYFVEIFFNYKFEKNFLFGMRLEYFYSQSSDDSLIDMDLNVNNKTILIKFLNIYQLEIKRDFNIYFSNFINTTQLVIDTLPSNYQINYINNLVNYKFFLLMQISSSNIPSMHNIGTNELSIKLLSNFNLESFSNFQTYGEIDTLTLTSSDPSSIIPFPFPSGVSKLKINYQIDKPLDFIDLSKFENLGPLIISNAGVLFNLDGELPFINMQNINTLEFSNGRINYFNWTNLLTNFDYLTMENNGMTGTIPTTFPNGSGWFNLKGNKLTGEIDESWCGNIFDISHNFIGGQLPSCFKCHYLQPEINTRLSGNRFINFNPNNPEPCKTLELNLSYNNNNNNNNNNDSSFHQLILYGNDLGYSTSMRLLDNPNLGITTIIACKEFKITKAPWKTGVLPKVINITFPFLPQGPRTFEISAYNEFLPQIDSMVRYSDYFIINGKYFAYNQSVINVLISNHPCSIITSNFNRIQCYLSNSIQIINNNNNNELITCIIQVMNVSSTFNFTVNQACNGDNCPIADCGKYGEYNYESGVCDCYSNESRGYSCELKSLDCSSKDCSGNGYCNQIIGKCECNKNRIYDDCSGIICNDGKGCYNGGNCNFQSGICNCSSKWIETSACTIPKQSVDSQQLQQNKNDQILTLIGWFGDINKFLTISIDGKVCDIISNDNESIQCIPPNYDCELIKTSSFKLSVSQNNYIWDGIYNPIFINGCNNDEDSSSSSFGSIGNSDNSDEKKNSSSPFSSSKNSIIIISIVLSLILLGLLGILFFKKIIIKNNYFNLNNIEVNINSIEDDYDQPDKLTKNKIILIQLKS